MGRGKYFVVGLLAILALQQSLAKPTETVPDCTGLPNGTKLPGKNPPNFYYCQDGIAIPMFCPPGFNFCYNGQTATCEKQCANVTPEPTPAPTTTTPTPAPTTTAPTTAAPTTTTEAPTTTTTAATTTSAPPSPEALCKNSPTGSIIPIPNDCSAFGICFFGEVFISRCLGGREFDPVLGVCTNNKCK